MLKHHLDAGGVSCVISVATSKDSFEAALAHEAFDLIVSDYNIPGYNVQDAMKLAREKR